MDKVPYVVVYMTNRCAICERTKAGTGWACEYCTRRIEAHRQADEQRRKEYEEEA